VARWLICFDNVPLAALPHNLIRHMGVLSARQTRIDLWELGGIQLSLAANDLWRLFTDPGGIDDEFERIGVLVLLHQLEVDKPSGVRN
jgi:hypothetical protein